MAVSISGRTFHCVDPKSLAGFWAAVLRFEVSDVPNEGALIVERNVPCPPEDTGGG